MKNKRVLSIALALTAGLSVIILFYRPKSKLIVQPMIDGKGIFIGEKQRANDSPYNYATEYAQQVRAIDETENYIRVGNDYFRNGRYEEAAKAYENAYSIGDKAVSGLKLAVTYENLGHYDEGIALLDQMIQNGELSRMGVQNANEIKSRLIAAKAAQNPS